MQVCILLFYTCPNVTSNIINRTTTITIYFVSSFECLDTQFVSSQSKLCSLLQIVILKFQVDKDVLKGLTNVLNKNAQ